VSGDGCSSTCTIETGYTCTGAPSVCTAICGDGKVLGTEVCDNGNGNNGIGCAFGCTGPASGYSCTAGSPTTASVCTPVCGDGILIAPEACDDGNTANNDGCSSTCTIETGWSCVYTPPSVCTPIHGDGLCVGTETCDTGGPPGCNANGIGSNPAYTCTGVNVTVCIPTCGNLIITPPENCEDGNAVSGDGCSSTC